MEKINELTKLITKQALFAAVITILLLAMGVITPYLAIPVWFTASCVMFFIWLADMSARAIFE